MGGWSVVIGGGVSTSVGLSLPPPNRGHDRNLHRTEERTENLTKKRPDEILILSLTAYALHPSR